jgi:PEP-CTERM motif-containing protein
MSMNRNLIGVGLVMTAFFVAQPARAATITVFNSQPLFLAAIGPSMTFDFNQPDGPISLLDGLASISTVGGDAQGTILSNTLCGSTGGSVDCFPPVLFTLAPGLVAFGYDNLDFNGSEEAVVTVNFTNGDPAQVFVFDLGANPIFTPIFFGITSDVDISTVMIYSRDPGTNNVGQRANVIDNVILAERGTEVVPEPTSLLLFGTGLAASLRRWRRRA